MHIILLFSFPWIKLNSDSEYYEHFITGPTPSHHRTAISFSVCSEPEETSPKLNTNTTPLSQQGSNEHRLYVDDRKSKMESLAAEERLRYEDER